MSAAAEFGANGPRLAAGAIPASPIIAAMPPRVARIIEKAGRKNSGRFGDIVKCDTDLIFVVSGAMAVANVEGAPGVELIGPGSVYGLENLFEAARPDPSMVVLNTSWIAVEASILSQVTTPSWAERLFAHQALRRLRVLSHDALCAREHFQGARLATLLLKLHDASDDTVIRIHQDHLAMLLGTSRTVVNAKAVELQSIGAIRVSRGHIKIVDRDRLSEEACCYRTWR